jgi:hypothetical protein
MRRTHFPPTRLSVCRFDVQDDEFGSFIHHSQGRGSPSSSSEAGGRAYGGEGVLGGNTQAPVRFPAVRPSGPAPQNDSADDGEGEEMAQESAIHQQLRYLREGCRRTGQAVHDAAAQAAFALRVGAGVVTPGNLQAAYFNAVSGTWF